VDDVALNNHFNYNEFINAGYVTYSNKIKDFGFQLGLRVENTYSKGDLVTTGETFTKKYTGLFPSVNLSQKIGLSNELQLTYSRRLNRPRGGDLNPFIESSDPFNIRRGNPDLNPEYINSFELSYLRFFTGTFLTGTVFYRRTDDVITRFRINIDSVTTLTYPVNLAKSNSYGVEFIANTQPLDWFSLNTSFSYFNTKITGDNIQSDLSSSGNSWTAKTNATFKMWGGINLTVMHNYQSRRPTALGYIEPMQSVDAAAKKDFMGGRLSIGVRAGDIFNQQKMNMVINQPDYTQTTIRQRDSQSLFLTMTYKLGTIFDQKKQQPPRRKKNEENNEGDDSDF
jgi:outer membrane receptor protein involved in Fe transport